MNIGPVNRKLPMHGYEQDRTRRLATVVAADIVGYSRLMDADEEGTYSALHAIRCELVEPGIELHKGRIVKHTGDGFLAEFPHVMSAIHFAMELQEEMGRRMAGVPDNLKIKFRIGINLGDIIIDDSGDIFGDGVNVAARLEPIAIPGGICISGAIYDSIHKKLDVEFNDGTRHSLEGLYTINEERLTALNAGALEALHAKGHLASVFMMLASLPQLAALIERKNARLDA